MNEFELSFVKEFVGHKCIVAASREASHTILDFGLDEMRQGGWGSDFAKATPDACAARFVGRFTLNGTFGKWLLLGAGLDPIR